MHYFKLFVPNQEQKFPQLQFAMILFLFSFLFHQTVYGQEDYRLSNFQVLADANIEGQGSHSKGLDVQFIYSPDTVNGVVHNFTVEIISNDYKIAAQNKEFTFTCNDSIQYLIDSLSIDSVPNLDTLIHIHLPYRSFDVEEGVHDVMIAIYVKGKALPIYKRPYRFQQIKIYDLFLDLKTAKVLEDSNVNPLGLKYNAPDPKWLVQVGVDELLHGVTERNAFAPKEKSFSTTITNYDTVNVCVYNADYSVMEYIGCMKIPHGSGDFDKKYSNVSLSSKVINASFDVQKIERKPAFSNFKVSEHYDYKSIKGIKVDFDYSLPLHYKRRNIRIKIMDETHRSIDNIIELKGDRDQDGSRIVGRYSYFISYYNLQNSKRVKLILTGSDKTIQQHQTEDLNIAKTIAGLHLEQTVGHVYKGISGILYRLDFELPELPKEGQLKLEFPSLTKACKEKLFYWNSEEVDKIYNGLHREIPSLPKQSIFVFLPYFVAPKHIHLTPKLTIEAIDVPPITLASFESKEYACPMSLNDIQIQATSNEEYLFTGLSGQLFRFNTTIPDYYHSKGFFDIHILENGQQMESNFFINEDANANRKQPIHNQKVMEVFIPYRYMKKGATYEVLLQAQNIDFHLSEPRSETYKNNGNNLQKIGLYLQRFFSKDWANVNYKIAVRNNQNMNSTYQHLSYNVVFEDNITGNYKADIPKSATFDVALHDDIIIWIKEKNMSDDNAIRIKTSLAELQAQNNSLEIKTKEILKEVLFKLISK